MPDINRNIIIYSVNFGYFWEIRVNYCNTKIHKIKSNSKESGNLVPGWGHWLVDLNWGEW
jgi:hypothetical protein